MYGLSHSQESMINLAISRSLGLSLFSLNAINRQVRTSFSFPEWQMSAAAAIVIVAFTVSVVVGYVERERALARWRTILRLLEWRTKEGDHLAAPTSRT